MENLHVDLAFTAAAIGTGIVSVGVLRAVERHAIERARRRTKEILARVGAAESTPVKETAEVATHSETDERVAGAVESPSS